MYFRCVFTLLHVTCSCIFHAYVPHFSSFFILIVFGAFLCVSLSPFLFLALVFSMAPKRKSGLSWNPLRFEASSSSLTDSTHSSVWFRDDKACKDFLENFSRWGIHSKCQVVLSDFFDTDLPTVIYSRGWESLCDISVTCPSMIIQEFYSNMHGFDYSVPHFVTRFWGTGIVVTPDIVSEVLHVPKVAHPDYPSCDRLRIVSKDELSTLFCETPSWGEPSKYHLLEFCKRSKIP